MFEEFSKSKTLCQSSFLPEDPSKPSEKVLISKNLFKELIKICLDALPDKAYGLVGGKDIYHPQSIYPCSTNLRNTPEWKVVFDSFGEFYRNPDLGFVIAPSEVKTVMDTMAVRDEFFIGVFHSHRFLCAEPTVADTSLSSDPGLLCYIISVARPSRPEVGIYRLVNNNCQKIPFITI